MENLLYAIASDEDSWLGKSFFPTTDELADWWT